MKVVATDNLINRSGSRFPAGELIRLADYLRRVLAIVDHELCFGHAWGKVTDAYVELAEPPELVGSHIDFNRAIIQLEGYQRVVAVVDPFSHPIADRAVVDSPISICALYAQMTCPLCSEDVWDCKHSFREIPYINRTGVLDAIELSLVAAAAVRAAKVLEV